MMFPHWIWQWDKSVSPKYRSKVLVATGKYGHMPHGMVNYHTEAWPDRYSDQCSNRDRISSDTVGLHVYAALSTSDLLLS